MVWLHTSGRKIKQLTDDTDCKSQEIDYKPNGLWLALGSAWINFADNGGMPGWQKGIKYTYKFNFKKDINVIRISTFDEFVKFHDKYVVKTFSHEYRGDKLFNYYINWPKVCHEYDGIIFTNFNKIRDELYNLLKDERKLKTHIGESSFLIFRWYRYIDLDSACIWKPSKVISSFEEVALDKNLSSLKSL